MAANTICCQFGIICLAIIAPSWREWKSLCSSYGGVYIGVAILWLWLVEGVAPTRWDIVGSLVAISGMAIIMFDPRGE